VSDWRARAARIDAQITAGLTARLDRLPAHRARAVRMAVGIWTHTGDGLVWLAVGVLAWRFGSGFWARLGERIVLATALAWCLSTILKYLIRRPRPEGAAGGFFVEFDQHAFPSGHAARVGALLVAVGALLPWWGVIALLVWGVSVAISRVVLRLHHALDVVVGLLVGAGVGALLALLL
jgi:undecaprenyl-diphosphatase